MKYNPSAGTDINHACDVAVEMAIKHGCEVTFDFNGIEMIASHESTPSVMAEFYYAECQRRKNEWEQSPAGKAEKNRRINEIARRNTRASELLGTIDSILELPDSPDRMDAIMGWLKEFAPIADDTGVKFDTHLLSTKFEKSGFCKNEFVGKDPSFFNSRIVMGRYIIGQVISCLHIGMPPHPVTLSFIERYEKLLS